MFRLYLNEQQCNVSLTESCSISHVKKIFFLSILTNNNMRDSFNYVQIYFINLNKWSLLRCPNVKWVKLRNKHFSQIHKPENETKIFVIRKVLINWLTISRGVKTNNICLITLSLITFLTIKERKRFNTLLMILGTEIKTKFKEE